MHQALRLPGEQQLEQVHALAERDARQRAADADERRPEDDAREVLVPEQDQSQAGEEREGQTNEFADRRVHCLTRPPSSVGRTGNSKFAADRGARRGNRASRLAAALQPVVARPGARLACRGLRWIRSPAEDPLPGRLREQDYDATPKDPWQHALLLVAGLASLAYSLSHDAPCGSAPALADKAVAMRAIAYRCYGSPEVLRLETLAKPTPADDELLVRVHAASLNPLDWHYMRGKPYLVRIRYRLRPAQQSTPRGRFRRHGRGRRPERHRASSPATRYSAAARAHLASTSPCARHVPWRSSPPT